MRPEGLGRAHMDCGLSTNIFHEKGTISSYSTTTAIEFQDFFATHLPQAETDLNRQWRVHAGYGGQPFVARIANIREKKTRKPY